MDRIYDLLRGVESAIKNQTDATILPVPVVNVDNLEDTAKPHIKPELVDQSNNETESNKQKEVVNKLQNSNPDNSVSVPNGDQTLATAKLKIGDKVRNVNSSCMHYGSEGMVKDIAELPEHIGYVIGYQTTNSGQNWTVDQYLRKTEDQLTLVDSFDDYGLAEEDEGESAEDEMNEYKNDFLEMNIGSLKAIMSHAKNILEALNNESVKENLTESWLQGKIAITEDYMRTIHDFVMYVSEDADDLSVGSKKGLWDNIRKKKQREGKNYKPAKPGDKDRPDPEMWKKLTKDSKKSE